VPTYARVTRVKTPSEPPIMYLIPPQRYNSQEPVRWLPGYYSSTYVIRQGATDLDDEYGSQEHWRSPKDNEEQTNDRDLLGPMVWKMLADT
jgi:hypothetical protein